MSVALARSMVILGGNRIPGGTLYGLNGQTITGDANGAWSIAANGTNQNITLTSSGSGNVILATGANYFDVGAAGRHFGASSSTENFLYSGSNNLRIRNNTDSASIFILTNSGHILVAGLAVDGTGVLQFPAATTSAGGIAFGTDVFLFRGAANQLNLTATTVKFNDGSNAFLASGSGGSMTLQTNGATALILDTSQNATFVGKAVGYAGVTTAGWGTPAIYAAGTVSAQTARSAAIATYTVGAADGTFEVGGNVNVTTSTTHSFSLDCTYTDETNTSRTLIMPVAQLAGAFVASGLITNTTGAGPYEAPCMTIRCKASTAITIRPSAGTFTTVTYNAAAHIKQVA